MCECNNQINITLLNQCEYCEEYFCDECFNAEEGLSNKCNENLNIN